VTDQAGPVLRPCLTCSAGDKFTKICQRGRPIFLLGQKDQFGCADSWGISTEKIDGVADSDEIEMRCTVRCGGRMKKDQEQTPAEKEERRHAVAVRRIMEDRDKKKTSVS